MLVLLQTHKKIILILTVCIAGLAFLTYSFVSPNGIFSGLQNDLKNIEKEGAAAYTDLDGNPVSLSIFKGQSLIINAWASWIPFSQEELRLLAKVKKDKGDSITIIAINRMEDITTIKSYLEFIGKPEGIVFLSDPTDNFYKVVGGYAMPETMFYTRDGVVVTHKRGVLKEDELLDYVQGIQQ